MKQKTAGKSGDNKRFFLLVALLLLAAVVGFGVGYVASHSNPNPRGTWVLDEVTAYRFDKDGTGALVLPDKEYPFRYRADDGTLTLDFEDEAVTDAVYQYRRERDRLILEAGQNQYILTRQKAAKSG